MVEATPLVIGVDIGGTNTTAALAALDGQLLQRERRTTDRAVGATGALQTICRLVESLLRNAPNECEVIGVGVGFGGPVDYETGTVLLSHHVPGWEGVPLKAELERRLQMPAVVDNDANAAGLGEQLFGSARGQQHVLYLNLGTGIGGAVIANGEVVRGAQSAAGEIGHMVLWPEGPHCTCGKRGCLESLASGPAIARWAEELRHADLPTGLPRGATGELVCQFAAAGDALGKRVLAEITEWLARGIGVAVNLLNPGVVVLGGGVSELGEQLLGPLRGAVSRYALPQTATGLRLVQAELGYDSGVRGGVAVAVKTLRPNGASPVPAVFDIN